MSLKLNKILWGILNDIKQWVHLCLDGCIIVNISYVWSGNPCSHLGFIPQQTAHLAVETQSPGDRLWAISMLGIWQPTHTEMESWFRLTPKKSPKSVQLANPLRGESISHWWISSQTACAQKLFLCHHHVYCQTSSMRCTKSRLVNNVVAY